MKRCVLMAWCQTSLSLAFLQAVKVKVKADIALPGNPISELRDVTCHMRSHSVTCHPTQVNALRPKPNHAGWYSIYLPGRMEGWVDLVDLIAPRLGVEPATFRSRVRRRTAAPPSPLDPEVQEGRSSSIIVLSQVVLGRPMGISLLHSAGGLSVRSGNDTVMVLLGSRKSKVPRETQPQFNVMLTLDREMWLIISSPALDWPRYYFCLKLIETQVQTQQPIWWSISIIILFISVIIPL